MNYDLKLQNVYEFIVIALLFGVAGSMYWWCTKDTLA